MKKFRTIAFILAILLTSCGSQISTKELSKEVEEKYLNMSKENIELLNDEGIEALDEKFSEEMKKAITEDTKKQVEQLLKENGKFVEFAKAKAVGQKDDKTQENYIITQVETKYEKSSLIFTINYNEDEEISGLFFK